jgi:hypothetical protein
MHRIRLFCCSLVSTALLIVTPALATHFSQSALPAEVQVPNGHSIAWEIVGNGEATYECQSTAAGLEWILLGLNASLRSRDGHPIGTYYDPPATWLAGDGSLLTAAQITVAPVEHDQLPYERVTVNPTPKHGTFGGITFIQRVALLGGIAPTMLCNVGERTKVTYEADYIFWKAN